MRVWARRYPDSRSSPAPFLSLGRLQPRRPGPRNRARSRNRRRPRRAMERRSSCRAWSARDAPLAQRSRSRGSQPSAQNAPDSPCEAAAAVTSRQFSAHHRWRCPSHRRVLTFRHPSTIPASGSINWISLFHLTGAWGIIPPTATPTYATTSTG